MIDSVFRKDRKYYPQTFLECKYVVKEKKTSKFLADNIEISSHDSEKEGSDDSEKEDSDEENSGEENFNEEN